MMQYPIVKCDGLCFLVAYQLNSLFIFMMLFLFNVQLRNKYDGDDDDVCVPTVDRLESLPSPRWFIVRSSGSMPGDDLLRYILLL